MMVELELVIQWTSAGYIFDPISMLLVLNSVFDLVNLRKLSPGMRGCANDDRTTAGVSLNMMWLRLDEILIGIITPDFSCEVNRNIIWRETG